MSRSAARRPWHFAEFERFGKKLSMDDVRRILRGLTFTAVEDRNTWKTL
ncbi:hypothetical protein [Actinoplanes solisilvae]|nr:hypothetical protein [Actinoplanes solisilvae]